MPSNDIKLPHKHITLPNNSSTNFIEKNLNKHGIKTVTLFFKTIRDFIHFLVKISGPMPAFIVFRAKTVN